MNRIEESLNQAGDELRHAADRMPPMQPPKPRPMRSAVAFTVGIVAVLLVVALPALLFGGGPSQDGVAAEATLRGGGAEPTTQLETQGFTSVHRIGGSGDLVGLRDRRLMMSSDNGEHWSQIASGEHVLLAVAPDGAVIAVSSGPSTEFTVEAGWQGNDTPTVFRFDPTTGEESTQRLPRPELAVDDSAVAPNDSSCGSGSLQSWISPVAAASGPQVAIVADNRVTGDATCDENHQFIWTSTDGISWSIIPQVDTEQNVAGVIWAGNQYVIYGSRQPSYVQSSDGGLFLWTSTDLTTFTPQYVEQPDLAEDQILRVQNEVEGGADDQNTIWVDPETSNVVVTVAILQLKAGLDRIADAEQLADWLTEAGIAASVQEVNDTLDALNVDFPLDGTEIDTLERALLVTEPAGHVDISTEIRASS